MKKKLFVIILALILVFACVALASNGKFTGQRPDPGSVPQQGQQDPAPKPPEQKQEEAPGRKDETPEKKDDSKLDEKGSYTSKEDVALYIWTYGKLPGNFITKKEAQALGWEGGGLDKYAKGKSIGGDKFGNYEGLLPKNYKYYECDIDTKGKKERGAKRIVFAEGGKLVYYTEDHYKTFELLYGEEK